MQASQLGRFAWFFPAFLLICAPMAAAVDPEPAWEQIDDDDGIRVSKREIPGQELPGFRGEAIIKAPIEKLVAVVKDHAHHTEWMHRCVEAAQLKDLGNERSIDYNRTDAPWPVWDRDVILAAEWTHNAEGTLWVLSFKNTDPTLRPLPDKTVRMPKLVGFYKFWKLDANKTKVVYQVEADPGGSLPTWLSKSVARDLPYNTLSALRARATK